MSSGFAWGGQSCVGPLAAAAKIIDTSRAMLPEKPGHSAVHLPETEESNRVTCKWSVNSYPARLWIAKEILF